MAALVWKSQPSLQLESKPPVQLERLEKEARNHSKANDHLMMYHRPQPSADEDFGKGCQAETALWMAIHGMRNLDLENHPLAAQIRLSQIAHSAE